jgi:hypothetical protein
MCPDEMTPRIAPQGHLVTPDDLPLSRFTVPVTDSGWTGAGGCFRSNCRSGPAM